MKKGKIKYRALNRFRRSSDSDCCIHISANKDHSDEGYYAYAHIFFLSSRDKDRHIANNHFKTLDKAFWWADSQVDYKHCRLKQDYIDMLTRE
jgi:hypothetical protein